MSLSKLKPEVIVRKGEPIDRHTVEMAITFGFVLVVVMQTLGTLVASAIWKRPFA